MPHVEKNVSLRPYHTFQLNAKAQFFCTCNSLTEIREILQDPTYQTYQKLILGGGSNMLFTQDFKGLVIYINLKGMEVIDENEEFVRVRVGAGEDWDKFVEYTVQQNWSGLENLSYIPGNVGASPIQNIGAYGDEVKNTISKVETLDVDSLQTVEYTNKQCQFGYRNSIFKKQLKHKRIVTRVTFELRKNHVFNLDYGVLKDTVQGKGKITLQNIRNAVIEIRKSKLPEPDELGSAGSFFKNPVITKSQLDKLQQQFPNIPFYALEEDKNKVPAGWLIDQLGWKGFRKGDAGVHRKQALVLVNYGNASGREIYDLSQEIRESVYKRYGIGLEYEVNIL